MSHSESQETAKAVGPDVQPFYMRCDKHPCEPHCYRNNLAACAQRARLPPSAFSPWHHAGILDRHWKQETAQLARKAVLKQVEGEVGTLRMTAQVLVNHQSTEHRDPRVWKVPTGLSPQNRKSVTTR